MTMQTKEGADGAVRDGNVSKLPVVGGRENRVDFIGRGVEGEPGRIRGQWRAGSVPQGENEGDREVPEVDGPTDPVEEAIDEFAGALLSMDDAIRRCDRIDEAAGRIVRARRNLARLCRGS